MTLQGMTKAEYEAFKNEVRNALPFATLRIHSEKYCIGAIDIRPLKKNGWKFTDEQLDAIAALLTAKNLTVTQTNIWNSENRNFCYRDGVNYVYKLIAL